MDGFPGSRVTLAGMATTLATGNLARKCHPGSENDPGGKKHWVSRKSHKGGKTLWSYREIYGAAIIRELYGEREGFLPQGGA